MNVAGTEQQDLLQVEKIIHSVTFKNAEALRRLFAYLAQKAQAGEADGLKEYAIGLDAFHKPTDYDPRTDSIVRFQVGRLRQKLAEYYRTEGKDDEIVIELPKGGFKLSFERHEPPVLPETLLPAAISVASAPPWRTMTAVLAVLLTASLGWIVRSAARASVGTQEEEWTPAIEALWGPFLKGARPAVISFATPLFVSLGRVQYRDLSVTQWDDYEKSEGLAGLRKALGNPKIVPRNHYAPVGEVNSVFLLAKLLGPRSPNLSLTKSSHFTWQQFADNNTLFLGTPSVFEEALRSLPVELEMRSERGGVRVVHPAPGEPDLYNDQLAKGNSEDGEAFAILTSAPGPMMQNRVSGFTSNTTPGSLGAVQMVTEPAAAQALVDKLRRPSGKMPEYYQVLLKVAFRDTVPVETTYVLHRELHVTAGSTH